MAARRPLEEAGMSSRPMKAARGAGPDADPKAVEVPKTLYKRLTLATGGCVRLPVGMLKAQRQQKVEPEPPMKSAKRPPAAKPQQPAKTTASARSSNTTPRPPASAPEKSSAQAPRPPASGPGEFFQSSNGIPRPPGSGPGKKSNGVGPTPPGAGTGSKPRPPSTPPPEAIIRREVVLIGIGGPSGAGKSTLAKRLSLHFNSPLHPLCLDSFLEPKWMPTDANGEKNWETPKGVDFQQLHDDLYRISQMYAMMEAPPRKCLVGRGDNVEDMCRSAFDRSSFGEDPVYIFAEGFLLFFDERVADLFSYKFWLEPDLDTCVERRFRRGKSTGKRDIQTTLRWFERQVWPTFQENRDTQLQHAGPNLIRLSVDGDRGQTFDEASSILTSSLRQDLEVMMAPARPDRSRPAEEHPENSSRMPPQQARPASEPLRIPPRVAAAAATPASEASVAPNLTRRQLPPPAQGSTAIARATLEASSGFGGNAAGQRTSASHWDSNSNYPTEPE